MTRKLVGVRTGFKELNNGEIEHGIYFIYEMEYVSGELVADGSEIAEVKYMAIDDVLVDSQVVALTREIVRSCANASPNAGLSKVNNEIQTNNKYFKYNVYSLV